MRPPVLSTILRKSVIHTHNNNPSGFLVENLHLLPEGKVLDVAMGGGRNSVFLASRGFLVEGIDISQEAIDGALKLAQEKKLEITTHLVDLEKEFFIEEASYDVIICFNFLQRSLIPRMKKGLRPGGVIVYETYIVDQVQFGKPTNPDYLLKHNELLDFFRDYRCLRYHEGIMEEGRAVAGIITKKGGKKMHDNKELCDKIREIYPEIGECGINIDTEWDADKNAWAVDLKSEGHELKTYLEPEDADGCMDGKQCVSLGLQIAQLKANIKTA